MQRTLWLYLRERLTTPQSRRRAFALVIASVMAGATTTEAGKKKKNKKHKKKGSGCGVVFEACCPDHTCQSDYECHTDSNVCYPPIPNL